MAVLTISREVGSRGAYIGQRVADALDYRFVDKESIELVLRDYGLQAHFQELYGSEPGLWTLFDRTRAVTLEMLNDVILALARRDNVVILGRGGYAVLGGFADVLNVRVQAPFAHRLPRAMDEFRIADRSEAEELLRERDRLRNNFVESSYHIRWDDSSAFNLVIDTSKVYPDKAIDWLAEAVEILEGQEFAGERTTRSIEVDSVLEVAVSELFRVPKADTG
jgi:cytidylate kinase